jgi:PAS domain-containing protein
MMNFGDPNGAAMDDFAFDMSTAAGMDNMMRSNAYPRSSADMQSGADLAIKTQFNNAAQPFSNMAAPGSNYASPIHTHADLDMGMSPYPNNMNMSLDMDDSLNSMMQSDMHMFGNGQFGSQMLNSPINTNNTPISTNNTPVNTNNTPINQGADFIGPLPAPQRTSQLVGQHQYDGMSSQDRSQSQNHVQDPMKSPSMNNTPDARSGQSNASLLSRHNSGMDQSRSSREQSHHQSDNKNNTSAATQLSLTSLDHQRPIAQDPTLDLPNQKLEQIKNSKLPWPEPPGGFPSTMHAKPHMQTQFKNAYSSSGFDMLGVLMRVATRPNPQIDIGSVDLSCAFVVCDTEMDDFPIVYCSENFERLTGYTRHMILGRNCRFLQSPDGKVEAGIKRNYCDDDSVLYLKNTISAATEAQISLINYRRGGQPFMNLLTMIPISWEPGGKVKFFVGFQVDLVEQPGAMTNKNPGKLAVFS